MLFFKFKQISTAKLQKQLSMKPTIVDVREENEYQDGHIPGAKNWPLSQITRGIDEPNYPQPWYLICRSGHRSKEAATILSDDGYKVIAVKGGMNAWQGAVTKTN
ncbi:rhodanese-like domain-containing protein [Lentilactobacillus kisonensis]|uniref:Rhodanese-like protein n=2 Tax=Lentilactobacillus kisonensis TaxID=481722 RepID=H1LFL3_9LACO|nr:rhodanese-like domain-containing protein [Lentilactobacillus kisonensis]EHO51728.1 rhodanese-like protein [Lentilactobacillus kisonensis F0435]KRL22023.1 rhodanese-like protein [Lentilactobacillus kisonensis DSM 19906 = JCM 15041]